MKKSADRTGLKKPNYIQKTMRPIQIVETGEKFKGINDCARRIGGNAGHICECLKGNRPTHLGFHFRYIEEE